MAGEIILPEQRRTAVTAISSDNSIMAVISRAAADPACDIDKLERGYCWACALTCRAAIAQSAC